MDLLTQKIANREYDESLNQFDLICDGGLFPYEKAEKVYSDYLKASELLKLYPNNSILKHNHEVLLFKNFCYEMAILC